MSNLEQKSKFKYTNSPFFFGFGMLALTILNQTFLSVYTYFYIDILGVTVALVTFAKTAYTVWDIINDPIFAMVRDGTKSKLGRSKFWLIVSMPLYLIGFILVFNPPASMVENGQIQSLSIWLLVALLIYESASVVQWSCFSSLQPELFQGDKQRSKAGLFIVIGEIIGIVIATVVSVELYMAFGYGAMSFIIAILYIAFMVMFIISIKENPKRQMGEKQKFFKSMAEVFKSKELWLFNVANCFAQSVNSLLGMGLLFYAEYSLNLEGSEVTIMMAAAFVPVVFLIKIWEKIINGLGAKKAWRLSFVIYALCVVPLFFANSFITGVFGALFAGFGMAGYLITPGVMAGRVVDDDFMKYGKRREGLITSVMTFVRQISVLIGTIIFFILGMLTGYESGTNPGNQPDLTFRLIMSVIPVILLAIGFVISMLCKGFNKDYKNEVIESE